MEYRSSEVRVGLFIFTSFIVLVVMVFLLGNLKDSFTSKKQLRIVFNFTGGLGIGAPVRYAGLDIGRVVGIELFGPKEEKHKDKVAVIAQINPSIELKKTAQAQIKTSGLMGGLYIDIRPGSSQSPDLADNEPLIGQDSFEIAKLGDIMGDFLAQVERFTNQTDALIEESRTTLVAVQKSLDRVDKLIDSNQGRLQAMLINMNQASTDLSNLLQPNGEVAKSIKNISSMTEKTNRLLTDKEKNIVAIIDDINKASHELEKLLADTRPALTDVAHNIDAQSKKVGGVVAGADSAMKKIDSAASSADGALKKIDHAAASADSALKKFDIAAGTADGALKKFDSVAASADHAVKKLETAASDADSALTQTNGILVENRRNLLEITKNLRETTQSLKEFTQDIKLNPWKLIRKEDEKEKSEPDRERPPGVQDSQLRMRRQDKLPAK